MLAREQWSWKIWEPRPSSQWQNGPPGPAQRGAPSPPPSPPPLLSTLLLVQDLPYAHDAGAKAARDALFAHLVEPSRAEQESGAIWVPEAPKTEEPLGGVGGVARGQGPPITSRPPTPQKIKTCHPLK